MWLGVEVSELGSGEVGYPSSARIIRVFNDVDNVETSYQQLSGHPRGSGAAKGFLGSDVAWFWTYPIL